jgi:anti-sigma factor RsiW
MADCTSIEALVTPYVDGELVGVERERVERHLRACHPCLTRVGAERAAHEAIRARRLTLAHECAPAPLRARCERLAEKRGRESPASLFPPDVRSAREAAPERIPVRASACARESPRALRVRRRLW